MKWNKSIRQLHRWVSIAFTLGVIVNGVAVKMGKYTNAVGMLALLPMVVLLITGLYLFAVPYFSRRS